MPPVSDATNKQVPLPLRPIGFRPSSDKQATIEEIKKWNHSKNPNFIQRQSYLTLGGVIATIVGAIIAFIGFKKDTRLTKWFGGVLSILAIGSTGVGHLGKLDLSLNFEENFLCELEKISKTEKSKRPEMRKALLEKYKERINEIKNILHDIISCNEQKSQKEDVALENEAIECNEVLHDIKIIRESIPAIKDKSKDIEARRNSASAIGEIKTLVSDEQVQVLIDCMKDKAENPEVRIATIDAIVEQARFGNIEKQTVVDHLLTLLREPSEGLNIRINAVEGIGELGDQNVQEVLREIRKKEESNEELEDAIVTAYGQIAERIKPKPDSPKTK